MSQKFGKHSIRATLLLAFISLFFPGKLSAQNEATFYVRDIVSAEIKGKTYNGIVNEIKNDGKYLLVTFYDGQGNKLNRRILASTATLVRSTRAKKAEQKNDLPSTDASNTKKSEGSKRDDDSATMRLWKKRDGSPIMTAKVLDQVDGFCRFENQNGEIVTIEISKLSIFDRIFLNKLARNVSPNAFAIGSVGEMSTKKMLGDAEKKYRIANYPLSTPNLSRIEKKVLLPTDEWNYRPTTQNCLIPSGIPINYEFKPLKYVYIDFEMVVSPNGTRGAIHEVTNTKTNTIQVLDLEKNSVGARFNIVLDELKLAGIDNDSQIATTAKNRVDVWSIADGEHLVGIEIPEGVEFAKLIDNEHLFTIDRRGDCIAWRWKTLESIYSFKTDRLNGPPFFSPDNKHFVIQTKSTISIVDSLNGNVTACLPRLETRCRAFAFSPSGKQMAGSQGKIINVWDLKTGRLTKRFSSEFGFSRATWLDEDHIMAGKGRIISTDLEVDIGNMAFIGSAMARDGSNIAWSVDHRSPSAAQPNVRVKIHPARLPTNEMKAAIAKFKSTEFLTLQPGMRIAIRLKLPFDQIETDEIYLHFKKQIEGNGGVVDDNSPIQLVTSIESGKRQTKVFGDIVENALGIDGKKQSVTYTPKYCKTIIRNEGGKILWESMSTCEPHPFIKLGIGNNSFEEVVTRQCTPSVRHFMPVIPRKHYKIPKTPMNNVRFSFPKEWEPTESN